MHVPRHGGSSEGPPGGPAVGPGSPEASRGSAAAICTCGLRRPAHRLPGPRCWCVQGDAQGAEQLFRKALEAQQQRQAGGIADADADDSAEEDSWEGVLLTFFLTTLPIHMRGQ